MKSLFISFPSVFAASPQYWRSQLRESYPSLGSSLTETSCYRREISGTTGINLAEAKLFDVRIPRRGDKTFSGCILCSTPFVPHRMMRLDARPRKTFLLMSSGDRRFVKKKERDKYKIIETAGLFFMFYIFIFFPFSFLVH